MGSVPCRNIAFAANGPCRSCCYAIDLPLQMLAHSMPVDSSQRNLRHLCYPKQVGPWAASGNDNSVRRQAAAPDIAQYLVQILLRSEEHTSELQSLMRISYAVFCLKKKNNTN